ncbi:MAG: porin family protein [Bacteroidaceae bacterium]|nr:porin family protein [Bacteroidaceae bacterium]
MKKIVSVLMVAVALMMAVPAQAQLVKFGVKGGMNFSELDLNVKSVEGVKEKSTGFFIGPMAEITLPIIGLGIDGAVMYSQRGSDELKEQGLEIPVNLKYTIGLGSILGVYIAAGPDFFFNFKDVDLENVDAKKTQVALNLGAGVKLLKKLQVGVNYQIPMGDSFELQDAGKAITAKNKTLQASIAYIF